MKFSKSLIECMGVCFPIAVLDFQQSQSCHCYSSLAFTNQVDYYSNFYCQKGMIEHLLLHAWQALPLHEATGKQKPLLSEKSLLLNCIVVD